MTGAVATSRIASLGREWMPSRSSSPPPRPLLRRRLRTHQRSSTLLKEDCSLRAGPCSTSRYVEDGSKVGLKRKKPMRIDIPKLPAMHLDAMGDPRVEIDVIEEEGESFSVYCKRGRRRKQLEDRHSAAIDDVGDSHVALFGVFDGHGGTGTVEFVSRNIHRHVMGEMAKVGEDVAKIEKAMATGYLKMDSEVLGEEVGGGACGVTAFVRNGLELVVSNAGDCRAVLSTDGTAEALTSDHKLSRDDERQRIESLGGYVDCYSGVWRVQGSLAVSRAFGDELMKEYVTAEPETKVVKLRREHEFLVLATDGLWDKVSNQEAVDVARPMLAGRAKGSVLDACKALAELSTARGSVDDVSVMIIRLGRSEISESWVVGGPLEGKERDVPSQRAASTDLACSGLDAY